MFRTRNATRLLTFAALSGLGLYYADEGDKGGGGGGEKKDKKDKGEPTKFELTPDELAQRVDSGVKAALDKVAEKSRLEKEEADRKAAEEQGEFKKLLEKEKDKSGQLATENRQLKIERDLRDHLAEKNPAYIGTAKYIMPQIAADVSEAELPKAIEKAVGEYVKDNPRQAKPTPTGAPPAPDNRRKAAEPVNGGGGRMGRNTAAASF